MAEYPPFSKVSRRRAEFQPACWQVGGSEENLAGNQVLPHRLNTTEEEAEPAWPPQPLNL